MFAHQTVIGVAAPNLIHFGIVHLEHSETFLEFFGILLFTLCLFLSFLTEDLEFDLFFPFFNTLIGVKDLVVDGGFEFRVLGALPVFSLVKHL